MPELFRTTSKSIGSVFRITYSVLVCVSTKADPSYMSIFSRRYCKVHRLAVHCSTICEMGTCEVLWKRSRFLPYPNNLSQIRIILTWFRNELWNSVLIWVITGGRTTNGGQIFAGIRQFLTQYSKISQQHQLFRSGTGLSKPMTRGKTTYNLQYVLHSSSSTVLPTPERYSR